MRVKRNPSISNISPRYLFPEIQQQTHTFLQRHPQADLIDLGIGDTTLPLPSFVAQKMSEKAASLATTAGYQGYGPPQGSPELQKKIAEQLYHGCVDPEEIFISDGAKCDIGRLHYLFGPDTAIAVQDPAYPVYGETYLLSGKSLPIDLMPCLPENDFFPTLPPAADIIYFCSPNNPTGIAATKKQLEELIAFARDHDILIIFDAAYSCFIQDPQLPQSIYEIEEARHVAIEVGSFSKIAGFTGLRLGWTVVPKELRFHDGTPVAQDWKRIVSTCFNGASLLSQSGGIAVLEDHAFLEIQQLTDYYLKNGMLLKKAFCALGFETYGGENAPYVWVKLPEKTSWQGFHAFLEKTRIVSVPGSGFGPAGEGFLRFSSFANRSAVEKAVERLKSFSL